MELDRIDREILVRLKADGRATHAAIAQEVGLTGPAVFARVRRMERNGVIKGYQADIDPSAEGKPLLAFIRVTTRPRLDETDSFETFVLADERIVECHDVDGEDSFILKVNCASPADLRELLLRIRSIPVVSRTVSSIALITIKGKGAPPTE
ncbi:MAG: hypothetical protein BGO01_00770 [Armatimonadetes bacterium 55-13]|nr:Lrp/AsnC family transcriptional regulator [Armatimonadota bacterium]OJU62337.1 MAG: hypothetical protein BGO01_00770 [Armatimonadetes bacterium 55-13]